MIESLNWKIVATSAVAAFVLSCIAGLISGVVLFVLLSRAFVAAVIFGLAGGAVPLLIARFLPELLGRKGNEPRGDMSEQDELGQQVDIMTEPLAAEELQTEPPPDIGPLDSEAATGTGHDDSSPMVDNEQLGEQLNEQLEQSGIKPENIENRDALVGAVQTMLREDEIKGR